MKRILLALCVPLLLVPASIGFAAGGGKLKDISCDDFLAMDPEQQDNVVYWLDGVAAGSTKKEVAAEDIDVGYDAFGRPVAAVVTACSADRKASLWEKVKAHFKKLKK